MDAGAVQNLETRARAAASRLKNATAPVERVATPPVCEVETIT
jgi:hypothetical protein